MPIWLRLFTVEKLKESLKEKEGHSQNTNEIDLSQPLSPEMRAKIMEGQSNTPSYSVKARK